MKEPNSKVWFITGASRGFGLEIAKAALRAGDYVVRGIRSKTDQLSAILSDPNGLMVVKLDVTNEKDVHTSVEQAIAHFGKIDVLVNNAGYGILAAIEEASDQETKKIFDTNVFGLLNVTRAILPYMRRQRSGHIINISSLFGYDSFPGWGLYGSSKFAVEGISKGLALELAPFGIHITVAAPGHFSTSFLSGDSCSRSENIISDYENTAVGQMRKNIDQLHGNQPGDPKKLAELIVKLAHTESPPLHLPIGKDAIAMCKNNIEKMSKEINEWEPLSSDTDHEQTNLIN
ncbi:MULTISPECIES: oxidoreductase [Niastella]|uniref:SDR family NAD(P)-dependent oxidoreductase n=1 Tax=Niastella soli TaxID=2821487 RepID=A0ABS3YRF6_9BACT|nr:oxidoreductase [Niastella soli]MBO9200479.1 SDR family NAD(P)-dependent oxidoreductase [Niastella soli]